MTLSVGRISSVISGVNTVKGSGIARNYRMLQKSTSFYGMASLGSIVAGITTKESGLMFPTLASMLMANKCHNLLNKLEPEYTKILRRAIKINSKHL